MKKIRYNIASEKKVDTLRIFLIGFILFLLSLIFISVGIWKLAVQTIKERNEVEELNILKQKLTSVSGQSVEYKKKINGMKKSWAKRINFSNSLIGWKSFSLVDKLNDLETRIPAGVFVNNLSMVNDSQPVVLAGFVSSSFKNLLVLYKQLSRYNIVIKKETVLPGGLYSADLYIKISDEKN
jgi:hypothetical protein